MNELNIILNVVVLIAVMFVGFVLGNLIKSQKEKIETLEKYSKLLNDYTKIFDLDIVKKYISNKEEIMKQDLEILKRKTIKDTTQAVSRDFVESAMKEFPKDVSIILNDLSQFIRWFYLLNYPDKTEREKAIVKMFPNSHKVIIAYINQTDHKEEKVTHE